MSQVDQAHREPFKGPSSSLALSKPRPFLTTSSSWLASRSSRSSLRCGDSRLLFGGGESVTSSTSRLRLGGVESCRRRGGVESCRPRLGGVIVGDRLRDRDLESGLGSLGVGVRLLDFARDLRGGGEGELRSGVEERRRRLGGVSSWYVSRSRSREGTRWWRRGGVILLALF